MAVVNGYTTLAELKSYIGLSGSGQDTNLENAINGASRQIDAITGRFFYQTSSESKFFTPVNVIFLEVPDISTPSGLVVQLDTTDDGSYDKTLTIDTDFYLKPIDAGNQVDGEEFAPITEIAILDTRSSERFDPTIIKNVKINEAVKAAINCNKPAVIDVAVDPKALYSFRRDSFKHRIK